MKTTYKGLVQVYTGQGKGKTTAAFGQALRSAGRGLNVIIVQFLKEDGASGGEAQAVRRTLLPIKVRQYGRSLLGKPSAAQVKKARERVRLGLAYAEKAIATGKVDVVVLDEISHAVNLGLVDAAAVTALIEAKPESTELVLTGRDMPAEIVKKADLVTDMKNIRHPYESGVPARYGIEY